MSESLLCPCGSQQLFSNCCEPFIKHKACPSTPEALMRSRYTAYTQSDIDYIFKTMTGKALKESDRDASQEWAGTCEWLGLEILDAPEPHDTEGFVEFIAHYKEKGHVMKLHERSRFIYEKDQWYYTDGIFPEQQPVRTEKKIGRNEPCLCGSGKKFKKCCGRAS